MTPKEEESTRQRQIALLFVGILLAGTGFTLGQHFPHQKPCVTADCVRDRYGYSATLSIEDEYRSRWLSTNSTSLHAMQFTRGGFHLSYIDHDYPYMYSIDFANDTRRGNVIRVSVSDTKCMDDHRNDRDYFGCSDVYEGTLNLTPPYIPEPQFEPIDSKTYGSCPEQHTPNWIVQMSRIKLYSNATCTITCNDGKNESTFLLKTESKEGTIYAPTQEIYAGPDMNHCTMNCSGIFIGWSCNEART